MPYQSCTSGWIHNFQFLDSASPLTEQLVDAIDLKTRRFIDSFSILSKTKLTDQRFLNKTWDPIFYLSWGEWVFLYPCIRQGIESGLGTQLWYFYCTNWIYIVFNIKNCFVISDQVLIKGVYYLSKALTKIIIGMRGCLSYRRNPSSLIYPTLVTSGNKLVLSVVRIQKILPMILKCNTTLT